MDLKVVAGPSPGAPAALTAVTRVLRRGSLLLSQSGKTSSTVVGEPPQKMHRLVSGTDKIRATPLQPAWHSAVRPQSGEAGWPCSRQDTSGNIWPGAPPGGVDLAAAARAVRWPGSGLLVSPVAAEDGLSRGLLAGLCTRSQRQVFFPSSTARGLHRP